MRRVILALIAIAVAVVVPSVSSAQVPAGEVWPSTVVVPPSPSARSSRSSTQAEEWTSLAHEQYDAKRYREAIASFERALQLGADRPDVAALHIARAYAGLGNAKQAMRWQTQAAGYRARSGCAASLNARAGSLRERA
jgi:tetratricopeptide (TPR) repeat protein